MPRYIIKLTDAKDNKDYYLEWSSVVDAPVTHGMSLDEFKKYYQERYGTEGMRELDARLQRVEKNGISGVAPFDDLMAEMSCNRAGENETHLSLEGIIEKYCRKQPA